MDKPIEFVTTAVTPDGCKCCGDEKAETCLKWCFACADAQEVIGDILTEQILKNINVVRLDLENKKPTLPNLILRTLAKKGWWLVDKEHIKEAYKKGLPQR